MISSFTAILLRSGQKLSEKYLRKLPVIKSTPEQKKAMKPIILHEAAALDMNKLTPELRSAM